MELYDQSFLRVVIKGNTDVHIGTKVCGKSKILCRNTDPYIKEVLGNNYSGNDICKKCETAHNNGKRAWTPNPLGGSPSRSIGGYGGRITNEI